MLTWHVINACIGGLTVALSIFVVAAAPVVVFGCGVVGIVVVITIVDVVVVVVVAIFNVSR